MKGVIPMVQYHFRTNEGPSLGPIDSEEFRQRQEAGEINDDTMVWRSGMLEWTTFAGLRAIEERAARARRPEPPALPKPVVTSVPAARVQFLPCGLCEQEWPENLLLPHGRKRICGNCQRRQKEDAKKADSQKRAGGSFGLWLLKVLAIGIVCGGLLFTSMWMKQKAKQAQTKSSGQAQAVPQHLR